MTGTVHIALNVNGETKEFVAEPRLLLADALRGPCGLRGTHIGCEHGVCGACTVLADGQPIRSCLMFAVQVRGQRIETIESLALSEEELNPLQAAFQTHHGLQCGFCTPGILMSLTSLFRTDEHPTEAQIREHIQGHICRCTGYQQMIEAALEVSGRAVVAH